MTSTARIATSFALGAVFGIALVSLRHDHEDAEDRQFRGWLRERLQPLARKPALNEIDGLVFVDRQHEARA